MRKATREYIKNQKKIRKLISGPTVWYLEWGKYLKKTLKIKLFFTLATFKPS